MFCFEIRVEERIESPYFWRNSIRTETDTGSFGRLSADIKDGTIRQIKVLSI